MSIVTISRQSGSLGTQTARALAEALKSPLLDKESLERRLAEHGVTSASLEKYDEKRPGFWEIFSSDRNRYLHFLKTVIYEFVREGRGVLLGRGGQVLLAGIPGVLHVRIVAPSELRCRRLQEALGCDERRAEQILRHEDTDRAGFHRFFFNVNWDDPQLYDLILNTGSLSTAAAVAVLRSALREGGGKEREQEFRRVMADRCLQQEVETRILYQEKLPVKFLEATVRDGVVSLEGTVNTRMAVERCGQIAAAVPGVKEVQNHLYYSTDLYGYMPHA
ncbi:MAG: cytidylate kinase family protein [Spirochaetales bacterium]|nr:cytidylate kinase family protein [Spirochaetales bacterium]